MFEGYGHLDLVNLPIILARKVGCLLCHFI
jgi:hypothetical protein